MLKYFLKSVSKNKHAELDFKNRLKFLNRLNSFFCKA